MTEQIVDSQFQAMAQMAQALAVPVLVDVAAQPLEGGVDPAYGTVRWRTLFCGDRTATDSMVVGVAEFDPAGTLLPHRHAPPEVYFGLSGEGVVTIDGVPHRIAPGVGIFVPGYAQHGTVAGPEGLKILYVFPRDRFSDVEYSFAP